MSHHSADELARLDMLSALAKDAVAARVMAKNAYPAPGDLIGVRLNLNIWKSVRKTVHTLHKATNRDGYRSNKGFYRGEVVGYAPAVILRNAYFNVDQAAREKIASGAVAKSPMASIDGAYIRDAGQHETEGVEIRFNPKSVHLFATVEGNRPVRCAEEVTIIGHRAYARGHIEYYTAETAPEKKGSAPSAVVF